MNLIEVAEGASVAEEVGCVLLFLVNLQGPNWSPGPCVCLTVWAQLGAIDLIFKLWALKAHSQLVSF